jgi:hypothetical protein
VVQYYFWSGERLTKLLKSISYEINIRNGKFNDKEEIVKQNKEEKARKERD